MNLIQLFNKAMSDLEGQPVPFRLDGEEPARIKNLPLIKPKKGALLPTTLPDLNKLDQYKLKNFLTWALRKTQDMLSPFGEDPPKEFYTLFGTNLSECEEASCLIWYLCWKSRVPCRLMFCQILNPKTLNPFDLSGHMMASCRGWLMDAVYGNEFAAKANINTAKVDFISVSSWNLAGPFYLIEEDHRILEMR